MTKTELEAKIEALQAALDTKTQEQTHIEVKLIHLKNN